MKKLLLFALPFLMFACSSEEEIVSKPETTSVLIDINTNSKKSVNGGTVVAYARSTNFEAKSTVWDYVIKRDLHGEINRGVFKISDVAVGLNTFTASTTPYDSKKVYEVKSFVKPTTNSLQTATQEVAPMNLHSPYVLYSGNTNMNISNKNLNTVSINMNTNNGRIIAAFVMEDDLTQFYAYTTIKIEVDGSPTLTAALIKNYAVTFEWSNEKSISGKEVKYTINLYDSRAPNKVLKSYEIKRAIVASTSYSCIYVISRDNIIKSKEDVLDIVLRE